MVRMHNALGARRSLRPDGCLGATRAPFLFLVPLVLMVLWVPEGPAWAGQIPPEIPLLPRLGVGARAMGMGGAYSAVAEDYTALFYNPAGLAQIRRVEFAGAFDRRSLDQKNTYLGRTESTPLNKSGIHSLGFAYPFPTYRGSMVIGFSYNRVVPLDTDYFRSGAGGEVAAETESIQEDGSLGAWQAGFAAAVTSNLSLGATATLLTGTSQRSREFSFDHANGYDWERTSTTTDMDISAVSGVLGALYQSEQGFRLGLSIHLPEQYTLDGSVTEDVRRYEAAGDTLDYYDDYSFEDDLQLPARFTLAGSYTLRNLNHGTLLMSAEATYADWQEIDYAGPIRMDNRRYAYRPTTDLRLGVEYAFPTIPVRLRGGFISQPLAYKPIATDVFMGAYQEAKLKQDRRYVTLGAGILLDRSLTIDLAFAFGGYERYGNSASGRTTEKVEDQRIYLGAAFRL